MTFEEQVKEKVREVRDTLAQVEDVSRFGFVISVSGRVDGEVLISYSIEINYEPSVQGPRIAPVLEETLRRHGWIAQNTIKEITFIPPAPEAKDEIPF